MRFFFYSNENNEPAHVHITKGDGNGKVWLEPTIEVEYLYGFSKTDERSILIFMQANFENFKLKWHAYFAR